MKMYLHDKKIWSWLHRIILPAMLVVTILYIIASQYLLHITLTLGYAFFMIVSCLVWMGLVKRQQEQTMQNLLELFDRTEINTDYSDEALSPLQHKLYILVKSNTAISQRIMEEKERMNGLISDVAHQTKTPLANIIMYSDLLMETNQARQMDLESVEKIRGQAEKLRFLFDAMIKMSRCESGLISGNLHAGNNNIKELITKAVSDIYPLAGSREITIVTCCDASLTAYYDMKWTAEALFNLLENAVKYSQKGDCIQIDVQKYEMFLCIAVTDHGAGISPEEQQNIWKRFYRGKKNAREQGVGIGLYLTRQILLSEHGYVKVKSVEGEGSTFSIYLPIGCGLDEVK